MKFGGTSVGNAKRIKNVAKIVVDHFHQFGDVIIVISAMSSVTDLLVNCVKLAVGKKRFQFDKTLRLLHKLHIKTASELQLDKNSELALKRTLDSQFLQLKNLLESIFILGEVTKRGVDLITSFGERFSIHLVSYAIRNLGVKAESLESSDLIVTNDHFGSADPLLKESGNKMKTVIAKIFKKNAIPVITGFIGATKNGTVTTLGRGGSDFSATIIGYCLDASEVWIWKDVDGIMSADPKIVRDARTIEYISYNEAAELAYFGAKVIHPRTITPASTKRIPVRIKNTFNPNFPGTVISSERNQNKIGIKAITTIKDLFLVTVQGKGMLGVPGTAAKLFRVLADKSINVMFISQASSEHNITFIVKRQGASKIKGILNEAFQLELLHRRIEGIFIEDDIAILAVVGERMKGRPGLAGKTFSALGEKKVNIIAIAQGSSELNISMVVKEDDLIKAVRSIHHAFRLGK